MWTEALFKRTEFVANVCIVIVAIAVVVIGFRSYVLNGTRPDGGPLVGKRLELPGTRWSENQRTVLLVIQEGCQFCSESAQFYKRLALEVEGRQGFRVLAVSPQPTPQTEKYLAELGLQVQGVVRTSLSSLGVKGTPTLILVDSDGAVIESWLGKIPASSEAEVLRKILCYACGPS